MRAVRAHFSQYGPRGVPKGRVDVQNLVNGSTPCLFTSVNGPRTIYGAYIPAALAKHSGLSNENNKQITEGTDTD